MPTRISGISTAAISTLLLCILGCGPSGRDLSDEKWLALHESVQQERNEMQSERAEFARQRDLLEADRQKWEARARTEPIVAAAISAASLLICCSLPLILVALMLWPRTPEPAEEAISELLVEDLRRQVDRKIEDRKRIEGPQDQPRLKASNS